MKIVYILIMCLALSGCGDTFYPEREKSITEKKQLEELRQQNIYFERIAIALEHIAGRT